MKKDFWKELFRPENKKTRMNLFTALALGVLLLMLGNTFFTPKAEREESTAETLESKGKVSQSISQDKAERELEERMKTVLSKIEGAGEVEVMVTLKNSVQIVPAKNEKSEESTVTESGTQGNVKTTQNAKKETSVVMTEDGRGSTAPLILQEYVPEIEGVVIVAQGGEDPTIQNALSKAAQALLNVPAHKVAILKMK